MSREQEILTQFSSDALEIQGKYSALITSLTESYGKRPEYEELLELIKKMHNELVKRGTETIQHARETSEMMTSIRQVITDTVNRLIKTI